MKLDCPFKRTSVGCLLPPVEIGDDNPPFSYIPCVAISRIINHIKRDHSLDDIITYFEELLAEEFNKAILKEL